MAGGLRSLARPAGGTWGMSSRERVTQCRQTRGIVLTASQSSSWQLLPSVLFDGVESFCLGCDFLMFRCELVMDVS